MQTDVDSTHPPARIWSTVLGFGFVTGAMMLLLFVVAGIRTNLTAADYSPMAIASLTEWLTNVANDSADHVEFSMPLVVASVAGLTALAASIPRVTMTKNLSVHDALALTVWLATIGLLTWAALIVFVWIRGGLFDGIAVQGSLAAVPPAAMISVVLSFIVGRLSLRPLNEQLAVTRTRLQQLQRMVNPSADLTIPARLRRALRASVPVVGGSAVSVVGISAVLVSLYGMALGPAVSFAAACSVFGILTSMVASAIAGFRAHVTPLGGERDDDSIRVRHRNARWEMTTWVLGAVLTLTITGPVVLSGAGGLATAMWLFVSLGAVVIRVSTRPFVALAEASRASDLASTLRAEKRLADLIATSEAQSSLSKALA
ncbi:hypothetical protein [Microbacterium nymphoidis]|uniref:hypothetical protein n=1 Tax=Microbacterium nymphoidis TaxID=2898586 RepID=UPI001E4D05B1|nr:hypothetical protein [Microbacterium nymphoidis]MCD2498022.1 hypothetical protein [Microbacterium nymphoidis]